VSAGFRPNGAPAAFSAAAQPHKIGPVTLHDLLAGAGIEASPADDVEIGALAYRSEGVTEGALFFCVRGFTSDGHDFAPAAIERGAAALVCERGLRLGVPEVVVPDARAAMAPLAAAFYGHPTRQLRVIGVTGTNGKTTTAFLVRHLLERAGTRTGLLGTIWSVVGGRQAEVVRTTPEAPDLQRTFREMLNAGDSACVIEVSSHALELHRADAIAFDAAIFTNLTQDHLDFHGTLEDYFGAKRRLFVPSASTPPRVPVVNVDDDWGARLATELAEAGHGELVTFAIDRDADLRARAVRSSPSGAGFTCFLGEEQAEVKLPLPGRFNVSNALGAIAAVGTLGVQMPDAAESLASAPSVPGRFEPVEEGQGFSVLVDYAHTPDSIENVLVASRELLGPSGRLVCVFGAGGDRDRDKRPRMGEAARRLADHVVVTSDNPRSEDPEAIIAEIVEGAEAAARAGARSELEVEPDRAAAIERAITLAGDGDVVVIAGKGHEQGQEFEQGRKVPFDDREVAREALRALARRAA
jgi:UDP-N-acetylmuramoyl-L-alanyl-D-glutamate--2,6-diaminopimelate ligase